MKKIYLIVMVLCLIFIFTSVILAYSEFNPFAAQITCPVCDNAATYQIKWKYEYNHRFYLFRCFLNHYFWVRGD
jgi:hypothetical protein